MSAARQIRTSSSAYIPGLDGIRAIAFLLVFWAHALTPIAAYIPATLGVTIFFFLSGYLITTLLRRELESTGTLALGDFYLRRALRIFVPLWVVYALAAGFAHFVEHDSAGNLAGVCSALFYYYNYAVVLGYHAWPPLGLNVIWSLCVEEHFYLLFPLFYLWLARRNTPRSTQTRLLVGFCLLELAWRSMLVMFVGDHTLWTYYATDARLDSILWGSVLALTHNPVFREDRSVLPLRWPGLTFVCALALLGATLVPRSFVYKESLRYTLQALALYVIFSYAIPNIARWPLRWLEWRPLRYLGWISYVLYLAHDFILNVFGRYMPGRFYLTGPAAFVVSIAFATLLRYTLELPLQRLRGRLRHMGPAVQVPQETARFL